MELPELRRADRYRRALHRGMRGGRPPTLQAFRANRLDLPALWEGQRLLASVM